MIANGIVNLLRPDIGAYAPDDDYWYSAPGGGMSAAGLAVTPETAMKISAFFACVRVLGETVLSAPLKVYRRLPNGDREEAPEHPLWPILHGDDPNDVQTSSEWLETHTVHTAMRGTSYSEIKPGDRGPITTVEYVHPDRVELERLPSGVLRYKVREDNGRQRIVSAERMFRLPGLSGNGVTGLSVLAHARESLGISLALQQYAGRSFSNGVRTSGVLEMPGSLKDADKVERLRRQWQDVYAGSQNTGKTIILEDGLTYKQVSMSNEDAQMLASEQWQVTDIARWFRVPLIMIQEHEKSTSWGTGVEQQQIGFVVFTMLPWFIRIEKRIKKQLIQPLGGDYFCEFTIESLLRGDIKSRFEAYQIAAGGNAPFMNRNEIRRRENLNKGPSELDDFLQPMNMGTAGQEPAPRGAVGRTPAAQLEASTDPRLRGYAEVLVRQVVRKESEAVRKAAVRFADDGAGWSSWVSEFYEGIAGDLDERRLLPADVASAYASRQREALLQGGAAVAEANEEAKAGELLGLVLEATQ